MIRKSFRLTLFVLFLISILAGCTKTTEIAPLPLPPTVTQVPAIKILPPPTDTPTLPVQTLEPSPTASPINELPLTELVSVASDGTQGNADAIGPSISADGRYVAFSSEADNLVEGDTNGVADIFVHDMKTGETTRVSVSSDGTQGNNRAGPGASISGDGHYVAFKSSADNLVQGDTNGVQDIFVHDQVTGETTRVSVASDGTQANNWSAQGYCMCFYSGISISADGRYVTFNSTATNLVEGDTDKGPKIFVHDRLTGETIRIPVASDEPPEDEMSWGSSISADGRYVAFESWYPFDVFLYDRASGTTTRISESSDGMIGNSSSREPSISADGRYVVFRSDASNLVEGDANGVEDIFVHDQVTGKITRISAPNDVTQGNNGTGQGATISADGRYVMFTCWPSNWEEADINRVIDIFMYDMKTGQTELVSIASNGTHGNGYSYLPSISADGRYLAFASNATNLVEGDTTGYYNIFVRDLGTSKPPNASITELYGIWTGLWSNGHNVLMEFIATMRPRVGFEEVVHPGGDTGKEWFNVEGGILTFGDWVKGAWVEPFSASTDCINNPQATYKLYITSQDDLPKKLHFVLVGEDHCIDRQTFLDGQTLTWVVTYPP